MALHAASRASAPYTGALSGVALETVDGRRYAGSAAESAAYNPTLAPMQAALIAAYHGGSRLDSIRTAVLVEIEGAAISQLDLARAVLASVAPEATLERLLVHRG
jgi:cytidine deaminase